MTERWKVTEGAASYLKTIAKSLGAEGVDQLAAELGFKDAQDMADQMGFVNIYAYFSAPGNHLRYGEIEFLLIEKRARRVKETIPG